jgi:hypothetical protein
MSKFVGSLRRNELEGGFLELVAEDGAVYRLEGHPIDPTKFGQRVKIAGKVKSGGFGIHMTASPALHVDSIENA